MSWTPACGWHRSDGTHTRARTRRKEGDGPRTFLELSDGGGGRTGGGDSNAHRCRPQRRGCAQRTHARDGLHTRPPRARGRVGRLGASRRRTVAASSVLLVPRPPRPPPTLPGRITTQYMVDSVRKRHVIQLGSTEARDLAAGANSMRFEVSKPSLTTSASSPCSAPHESAHPQLCHHLGSCFFAVPVPTPLRRRSLRWT